MKLSVLTLSFLSLVGTTATTVRFSNQGATYWGLPPYIAEQEKYYEELGIALEYVTVSCGCILRLSSFIRFVIGQTSS